MTELLTAALFLPLSHYGLSRPRLRDHIVQRVGERAYRVLYSLVALGAVHWLVVAYRQAPASVLWIASPPLTYAMLPVVLLAFLLAVVGVTTLNPTTVGFAKHFKDPDIVRGVLRITRNPFLWGVSLWALAHVVLIGSVASLVGFGSITLLGLAGSVLLDAKKRRQHGPDWFAFAAVTSNVPFLAIIQGRQRFVPAEVGWWRITLAATLFTLVLWGHRCAFGGSPLPV